MTHDALDEVIAQRDRALADLRKEREAQARYFEATQRRIAALELKVKVLGG